MELQGLRIQGVGLKFKFRAKTTLQRWPHFQRKDLGGDREPVRACGNTGVRFKV